MSQCAGCLPVKNRMQATQLPSCLELIVFPNSAMQPPSIRLARHPSYQCLACDRVWLHDEHKGYQTSQQFQKAA
jgi:hypothetical protein